MSAKAQAAPWATPDAYPRVGSDYRGRAASPPRARARTHPPDAAGHRKSPSHTLPTTVVVTRPCATRLTAPAALIPIAAFSLHRRYRRFARLPFPRGPHLSLAICAAARPCPPLDAQRYRSPTPRSSTRALSRPTIPAMALAAALTGCSADAIAPAATSFRRCGRRDRLCGRSARARTAGPPRTCRAPPDPDCAASLRLLFVTPYDIAPPHAPRGPQARSRALGAPAFAARPAAPFALERHPPGPLPPPPRGAARQLPRSDAGRRASAHAGHTAA